MSLLYSLLYVAFLGIASHVIGEALPRRWFSRKKFPFHPWKWERDGRFYEKFHIRAWKDRLPDKSRRCRRMIPKRLGTDFSSERVHRLILETCVAEAVHGCLCLAAFPICFLWENAMGIVLTWIYIFCNLPFIMIQRYNRPALVALAERLEKREERKRNAGTHSVG
jgi:glycosyl-4,4'-diaponeurosporenoate acyltransferase